MSDQKTVFFLSLNRFPAPHDFVCDHFHKCQCRFPRVKFKHKGEHKREREREERKDLTEGDEREKRERERERVIAGARFEVSHNDSGVGAQEHTRTDWSSKALAKTLVDKKKKKNRIEQDT